MTSLHSVLEALADRPGVAGAAVVSDEGLMIASSLPESVDADAVAALLVSAQRALSALAASTMHGATEETVVASAAGAMALVRLHAGSTLLLLAAPDADLGTLLYEVRCHAPALAALV